MREETLAWFHEVVEQTSRRVGQLPDVAAEPELVQGKVVFDEGIEVVVGPGGALVSLTLSERAVRLGPVRLAERIVEAQKAATQEAAGKFTSLVGQLGGGAGADSGAVIDPLKALERARAAATDGDTENNGPDRATDRGYGADTGGRGYGSSTTDRRYDSSAGRGGRR
jgi:hypothetical protein